MTLKELGWNPEFETAFAPYREKGWVPEITSEPTGKKILVIGAGPSGLSAAWHRSSLLTI